jgi:hypothetical protein
MNRSLRKGSDTLVALLVLAAAAAGLGRDISVFYWKAGKLVTTRSEDRFGGLVLAGSERIGFVTDVPGAEATRRYYEALHRFAPTVILPGPDARSVLADVADPASIERICAQWKMRVALRPSAGVALLERE